MDVALIIFAAACFHLEQTPLPTFPPLPWYVLVLRPLRLCDAHVYPGCWRNEEHEAHHPLTSLFVHKVVLSAEKSCWQLLAASPALCAMIGARISVVENAGGI